MKTLLALTAALAMAAVLFAFYARGAPKGPAGVTRGLTPVLAAPKTAAPGLATIDLPAEGRVSEVEPARTSGPRLAPLSLQIISSVTGRPAPFLDLQIVDLHGTAMVGLTDKEGRLRGPAILAAGPVVVIAQMDHREEEDPIFGVTHSPPNPRAKVLLPPATASGEPGATLQCKLELRHRVPIRIFMGGFGVPVFDPEKHPLHIYAAVDSHPDSSLLHWTVAPPRPAQFPDYLLGATHMLFLKRVYGGNKAEFAWAPKDATEPNATRELEVFALVGDALYRGRTPAAILPEPGDTPLKVTLTQTDPDDPSAVAAKLRFPTLSKVPPSTAEPPPTPTNAAQPFQVVVRSATGTYAGPISVRASPSASAKALRLKRGNDPLRKQWIDARLESASGGEPKATVTLDALDEAEYEIRVICLEGESSKAPPVRVTVPHRGPSPLEILLPDR